MKDKSQNEFSLIYATSDLIMMPSLRHMTSSISYSTVDAMTQIAGRYRYFDQKFTSPILRFLSLSILLSQCVVPLACGGMSEQKSTQLLTQLMLPDDASLFCAQQRQPCVNLDRIHQNVTRKRVPILGRMLDAFHRLPLLLKVIVLFVMICVKFMLAFASLKFILQSSTNMTSSSGGSLEQSSWKSLLTQPFLTKEASIAGIVQPGLKGVSPLQINGVNQSSDKTAAAAMGMGMVGSGDQPPMRILHIVTALAEYNNGRRGTERGEDRLQKVFIPVLVSSVESMIAEPYNYEVDVYLILHFKLLPERRKLIEDALPEGVGLQVWDEATPIAYDQHKDKAMKPVTRGLARQHRFVIKDKIDQYDFFTVYEDDMRITGAHIDHFLHVTSEIQKLVDAAPETLEDDSLKERIPTKQQRFYGPMTKKQLKRLIPGMIRVEVLLDEEKMPAQPKLDPIAIDHDMPIGESGSTQEVHFDPVTCCHVPPNLGKLPPSPGKDQVMAWEASVKGAIVREVPKGGSDTLDWVLLQPGPKRLSKDEFIGGYWSGRDGNYGDLEQPGAGDPQLIAQGGGWMLTREQILDIHLNHCPGGFLPPYDDEYFRGEDGLIMNNVEFWSGGYGLFSGVRGGCNMQRIISLNPEHLSKHFIYHTANNKQKPGEIQKNRLVKVNNMVGQIITVIKNAQKFKEEQVTQNAQKFKEEQVTQ